MKTILFSAGFWILMMCVVPVAGTDGVGVSETGDAYTLDNGILVARIDKHSGKLASLRYKGMETLDRQGGYWSHSAAGPKVIDAITIDPKTNDGARAEVSIKGISGGQRMGSGPGGSTIADIEIRYSLGRGESGLYTYSIFDHPAAYPPTSVGEARYCAKLSDAVFDWMSVDANRNQMAITAEDWNRGTVLNMKEVRRMNTGAFKGHAEHKYDYTAGQFDTPAFGWSSTKKHVGLFFINPTIEYLSGGPTKVELCVHRDATFKEGDLTAPAPPCLLNYWRGSHYGGSVCNVAANENWTKVIGPFAIYCNSGETRDAMWKDALAAADKEARAWPYAWVNGIDYPHKAQRAAVSGKLVLDDPQAPNVKISNILVGLAAPEYKTQGGRGGTTTVDWQLDAKHYEFWVRAAADGKFTVPNVRPGKYTLYAIATGVLGQYSKADVAVGAGEALNLGELKWTPVRFGKQVWEIGVADRTASEFKHGDHYWQWGLYNEYPRDFPDDVNFTIGKSALRTDWNYCQCPRGDRPTGTPWTIRFEMPEIPSGKVSLRLAFAATSARRVDVSVNGTAAGAATGLIDTATIRRDGIRGYWYERDVVFDGSLLKKGENELKLIIPPGNAMNGIEYDYVRLEQGAPPAAQ